jgi:hypothetical protein
MGVGFQVPIKNLVSILISTAVKTARVVSLSGLKTLSFPLTGYSYEEFSGCTTTVFGAGSIVAKLVVGRYW